MYTYSHVFIQNVFIGRSETKGNNNSALYPKSSQLHREKTDYLFSIRKEKTTRAMSSRHIHLEDVFSPTDLDLS